MTPPATATSSRRRPLVGWGIAVLLLGLLISAGAAGALALRVGGDLARTFGAEPKDTPTVMVLDLNEGTYVVYEYTGLDRSAGPITTARLRGTTITPADVTVTGPDGREIPVATPDFDETLTRGSSTYTGAVEFETDVGGTYRVSVRTPDTTVFVAPSIGSMFTRSLAWVALLGLGGLTFFVGVVLLVVGLVRGRPAAVVSSGAAVAARPAPPIPVSQTPAGWYADPHGQAAVRWWDGRSWTDHVG